MFSERQLECWEHNGWCVMPKNPKQMLKDEPSMPLRSGLLRHILSSVISSRIEAPSLFISPSTGVRARFIPCACCAVTQRDSHGTLHRLKISGISDSNSVQIVQRFFSPLMQMKHHLGKEVTHEWGGQHRWCVIVCIVSRYLCVEYDLGNVCWICPRSRSWTGRTSNVVNRPPSIQKDVQRSQLSDSFPFVIYRSQFWLETVRTQEFGGKG